MDAVQAGVQTSNASVCLWPAKHHVEMKIWVEWHGASLRVACATAARLAEGQLAAINGEAHPRHRISLRAIRGPLTREAPIVDAPISPRIDLVRDRRLQFAPMLPEL